jgi:protoporphyrinogen oxidase
MWRVPPSAAATERGTPVVVAGAGPAGLSAALALVRAGRPVVVAERSDGVGGLARTYERNGFRFDVGGHRFSTRLPEISALWDELLGGDFLLRERRSRILFHGRFFDYPLTARTALAGLGPLESARILASYARAKLRPARPETTLADWLVNRFGRRLFETFFRPYTEKLWGLRCEELGAQWAAQRIRGLSVLAAIGDMLRRGRGGQRTLATSFRYPRLGPSMLWERMARGIACAGGTLLLRHRLAAVRTDASGVRAVELRGPDGPVEVPASHLVSTVPLRELVAALGPALPREAAEAAAGLRHRSYVEVVLVLEGGDPFPDTWLYLHDRGVRAGRAQNFRAWSPDLVPSPSHACVGLEYFCRAGDELWRTADAELVRLAEADLAAAGLPRGRTSASHVIRVADAYPIYDAGFAERVGALRAALRAVPNVSVAGRNGLHRYDNMDYAMWTGLRAARAALGEPLDPWGVEPEGYLES